MLQVVLAIASGILVALISPYAALAEKLPDRAAAVRLNNIGVAYMNQQRMDKAVEEFDAALVADPGFSIAELNKGIALLNSQKLPQAEATLNRASQADASNPRVWYNLGLLFRSGNPANAIEAFERVVKIDPNDPDTYYCCYWGEYDTRGQLKKPEDPFLYWVMPILAVKKSIDPMDLGRTIPEDQLYRVIDNGKDRKNRKILAYVFLHAGGDSNWRTHTKWIQYPGKNQYEEYQRGE